MTIADSGQQCNNQPMAGAANAGGGSDGDGNSNGSGNYGSSGGGKDNSGNSDGDDDDDKDDDNNSSSLLLNKFGSSARTITTTPLVNARANDQANATTNPRTDVVAARRWWQGRQGEMKASSSSSLSS